MLGNGFDISHGMGTSYGAFKDYVENVDHVLFECVEQYLAAGDKWADLEAALGCIDVDTLIDNAQEFLFSYGADDWSDRYHHSYQFVIEQVTDLLSVKLRNRFAEWISGIDQRYMELVRPKFQFEIGSKFLTFNYTTASLRCYGLPAKDVLFIHGCCTNDIEQIVLGHDWAPELQNVDGKHLGDVDPRVSEGQIILQQYFESTFKPTERIILENNAFFKGITNLTEVVVLGHSLAEVDLPYFKEILKRTPRVHWNISYHTEIDYDRVNWFVSEMNIGNFSFFKM